MLLKGILVNLDLMIPYSGVHDVRVSGVTLHNTKML